MIKISGSNIASITNGLHGLILDPERTFNQEETRVIVMAIELINLMYYHRPDMVKKDI